LMLTQKGERRTKPLRPPVLPLHRLIISAHHTMSHLKSCPIIAVVGGPCAKAGRQGLRKPASGGCPFRDQGLEGAPAFDAHQKG
jgi:hypothetical protein